MTVNWHALDAFGFSVFPLRPRDKKPLSAWEQYQSRKATADELARWAGNTDLNAAIATGAVSGIIVLDTDSDEADAEVRRRGVPETPTVRTANGRHYYFAHPGGSVRNFARKLPGCDLRGDGGYVVAPDSVHPTGVVYEWERSPADLPFAAPPGWLLELLKPPAPVHAPAPGRSPYAARALDGELATLRRASEGTRNDTLNRSAFNLGQLIGASVIERSEVERHLLATALAIGLAEAEARRTIASGVASGMAVPRVIPEHQHAARGGRTASAASVTNIADARPRQAVAAASTLRPIEPIRWQGEPVPERRWLVADWIPDRAVTALYGDGGVGKSLSAQQLLTSAATGAPWFGLPVKPCRAIGIFCEDPEDELWRRQAAINAAYGIDMGDLEGLQLLTRVSDDNLLMTFEPDGKGIRTDLFNELTEHARQVGAQLVVIDTAADVFGGNENIRNQVRQFIAALTRLAMDIDAAVVLCAHPSVDGLKSGHGFAGSTAWNNSVRSRLYLTQPPCEDEHEPSATEERLLTRKKANYARAGDEIRLKWREGVLVPEAHATGLFASIEKRSAERTFLELLAVLDERGLDVSNAPQGHHYAPKVMAALAQAKPFKIADLRRAMDRLFVDGAIRLVPVGPPSDRTKKIVATGVSGVPDDLRGSD